MGKQNKGLREVFASNLRAERARRGWSQEVLAEFSNSSQSYVSSVERASQAASLDFVERVAKALRVKPSSLFDEPRQQ